MALQSDLWQLPARKNLLHSLSTHTLTCSAPGYSPPGISVRISAHYKPNHPKTTKLLLILILIAFTDLFSYCHDLENPGRLIFFNDYIYQIVSLILESTW